MPKRIRFKPEIRMIKLNPEQAVLNCDCHNGNRTDISGNDGWIGYGAFCQTGNLKNMITYPCQKISWGASS